MSNAPKARPILFTGENVRAILDGRKAQTRRVIKRHVAGDVMHHREPHESPYPEWWDDCGIVHRCPYGVPGDLLWVREMFQPYVCDEAIDSNGEPMWELTDYETGKGFTVNYPASDGRMEMVNAENELSYACKPSIHMPRWASRLTLRVSNVHVERLQEIREEDARAEGVEPKVPGYADGRSSWLWPFRELWDSINAKRGYSWKSNPHVWVIEWDKVWRQNVVEVIRAV